jgi:hypothetical protein
MFSKFIRFVFFMVVFTSCGDSNQHSVEENEKTDQSSDEIGDSGESTNNFPIDTTIVIDLTKVKFFMPEEIATMQKYASDSTLFFMDYYLVNYFEINNDIDFIDNFNKLVQIFRFFREQLVVSPNVNSVIDGFNYPDNMISELSFLQYATPFVINTCVAECTEYAIDFDLTEMKKQASKTIGNLDDEYLELLQMAYELNFSLSNNFKSWFMQTWDYGGGSMLGNKSIYQFLKKSKQFEFKLMKNDSILDELKLDAYETAMHGVYMLAPVSILEEIKLIVNENLVSPEQATQLNKLANLIKSNATECSVCFFKELQMNCETGNCNYGG